MAPKTSACRIWVVETRHMGREPDGLEFVVGASNMAEARRYIKKVRQFEDGAGLLLKIFNWNTRTWEEV